MKITKVETMLLAIPFDDHGGKWTFDSDTKVLESLLLKVETDRGITGWGEIFTNNRGSALKAIVDRHVTPPLIGRNTREITRIKQDLEVAHHNLGRVGPLAFAIAGVDIALWDLLGKEAGLPLWRLLGGSSLTEVECYASLTRYGAQETAAQACARAVGQGYRAIKLHEIDTATVLASREAVGSDVKLMVDANCAWTLPEAMRAMRAMASVEIGWLEEPTWPPENLAALAKLRRTALTPIAAGENAGSLMDYRLMFEAGAVDIVQPDVTKALGISEMLRIAALAEAFNVEFVPHCFVPGPGYVATLHLCAALNHSPPLERFFVDLASEPMGEAMCPRDGRVALPNGPGLGCEPDSEVVRRFRIA